MGDAIDALVLLLFGCLAAIAALLTLIACIMLGWSYWIPPIVGVSAFWLIKRQIR